MRTAIMLNLHQPHGKGEYRFILLTFICFRLQDAQTPPSPKGEKGVGGMRGKGAHSHVRSSTNGLALSGNADTILTRRPNSSASAWHRRNPAP